MADDERRIHSKILLALSIALAACSSSGGSQGTAGEAGAVGQAGEAGAPAPSYGALAGTVTASATGNPIAGVQVVLTPGTVMATTAADGSFTMTVPVGAIGLTLQRTGYHDKTVAGISVGAVGVTHVALSLDTDPTADGPTVVVSDDLTAGYGAQVTVSAQATASDSDSGPLAFSWTQTAGVPASGLSGTSTPAITFTTLRLADAKPEASDGGLVPARFGPMSVSPDETGHYVFSLAVSDPEGHTTRTTVTVEATPPSSGLRNVPVGIPVWFEGDSLGSDAGPQTSYGWSLSVSQAPGSQATISSPSAQFVSFLPDVPGTYTIVESVSGKSANVYAHDWDGVSGADAGTGNDYVAQGCTSAGCHVGSPGIPWTGTGDNAPDMFAPWSGTKHASTFARELDGVTPDAGADCIACHTVGYSTFPPAAQSGGFGEVAQKDGWTFPAKPEPGTWAALVAAKPELAQLGNVQCESCHGPMNMRLMIGTSPETAPDGGADNVAAMSFASGVCGQCHGQESAYPKMDQWKSSPHSNLALSMQVATVDARGTGANHCGRCHAAQGYAQYAQQLAEGYTGYLTSDGLAAAMDGGPGSDGGPTQTNAATVQSLANLGLTSALVQPQTCAACHDPHGVSQNPFLLRLYDVLPGGLPNGQGAITGVGAGAVCMACHNQRNGTLGALSLAKNPGSIPTPHDGPQTDVLFGVNAFFVSPTPSPHLAVTDTCVGCHYGAPTAAQRAAGQTQNHSFVADLTICSKCHGGPGQVDGVALQSQVRSEMAALDALLFAKIADALSAAAGAGYTAISAQDTRTGSFLCAGASSGTPTYTFGVAPRASSIEEPQPPAHWRALTTLWMTFPSLAGTPECTASGALSGQSYDGSSPISVGLGSIQAGSAVFPPGGIIAEAIWNEALLHDDQTWGIHNLPFSLAIIENTTTQLETLP
jgi:hypothetical protein